MDVSIIIVNYNTSKLVNDAIDSVIRHTAGIDYEIIVVDNATEDLSQTLKEYSNPKIRTIQLSENVGFGQANNAALEIASGRNILFLNPDTKILNNAVTILSDYLDNHPECGVCVGILYN
ncbi:MAG: glycosyltransferase, partial [Muribaculaceae bacterium]|nr:glycosyltransferase [Muribaculaceae bacterium]